ncbi:creatininase family protein [Anaerobaca lacustris]|uniref:Creatininase family protein n=1 Tax=Anaerobaca lacustris TaxID=3044600 RepID=A0AAW6U2A7_9BACT|nr:creatininase family protein [Sedimentisphaerales bacterium M17dextr]
MTRKLRRRELLSAGAAGALFGSLSRGSEAEVSDLPASKEVRLEFLRPKELEEARAACATIFQPLGTIEWHGVHNVVGVDAVKAHALCVGAAQTGGGLVAPSLYGGVGGLNEPHTFIMDPEDDVFSRLLRPWLEQLCREMARDGFRAIIILTGHYGAAQQIVVRETAVRMSRALAIPVLGTPEYMLALDVDYTGDHAAWGETSLMMHLYPDTVRLSRLGDPPHRGVHGRDPKSQASAEDGRVLTETIVSRLATLARKMPTWDYETLDRFVDTEAALVARQLTAPRGKAPIWAAWSNVGTAMRDYGRLLAEERFEEIKACVARLGVRG